MEQTIKKLNILHIMNHMMFQFAGGIVYGFGIYMLVERGYTSFEAGICFACVNIVNIVFTPFISNYLDNNDKYSIFDVIIFLGFIGAVLMVINLIIGEKSLILTLAYIIGNGCNVLIDPLVSSISSKLKNYNIDVPFSPARAVGSASYGIVCIIFGFISKKYSYRSVIFGGIIFSVLLSIIGIFSRIVFNKVKNNNTIFGNEDKISIKEFCTNNILYIVTCFFILLIYFGYATADTFMLAVCENVGGSSDDMGYILGFKAFIEVIPIFIFPYILKRFKLENILYFSAMAFIIKVFLTYIAQNVFMLYVSEFFQGFSFGLITPGMIEYVNKYLKNREVVRGVSLHALALGIGCTISSFVGGYIADTFSIDSMNFFALIITIIGSIGFIFTIVYRSKKPI